MGQFRSAIRLFPSLKQLHPRVRKSMSPRKDSHESCDYDETWNDVNSPQEMIYLPGEGMMVVLFLHRFSISLSSSLCVCACPYVRLVKEDVQESV
jgi:hypothetical protein